LLSESIDEVIKTKFANIRTMARRELFVSMYENYVKDLAPFNPHINVRFARSYAEDYFRQEFFETVKIQLIETSDDEVVGFIIISNSTADNCTAPGTNWCIHEFYIKPESRRKGYGLEAIKEFQKEHTGKVCYFILHNNKVAEAFWSRVEQELGWTPLDTAPYQNGFFQKDFIANFYVSEVSSPSEGF